jgi:hypothetical protein
MCSILYILLLTVGVCRYLQRSKEKFITDNDGSPITGLRYAPKPCGAEPIPWDTPITTIEPNGIVVLYRRLTPKRTLKVGAWVVSRGDTNADKFRTTHGYVVIPTPNMPIVNLIANPAATAKRRMAAYANDGAVTLGEDGVPTFLDGITFPFTGAMKDQLLDATRAYYKAAEGVCNARLGINHHGIICLLAMPEADPLIGEETLLSKPPQIYPGHMIHVAYGPAYWIRTLVPDELGDQAEAMFTSIITGEVVASLQKEEQIPTQRYQVQILPDDHPCFVSLD